MGVWGVSEDDDVVWMFEWVFDVMVGGMCAARGSSRLSAILSAWYRARAREFDYVVCKRWGEMSDDDENDRMEMSVFEW